MDTDLFYGDCAMDSNATNVVCWWTRAKASPAALQQRDVLDIVQTGTVKTDCI